MPWPSPTDYNEAVQNPRLGFADPELKLGQPEMTPLGMPRPYSGAFATVYKLQCGANTWAVRCFNREFPDQQERYEAIGAHLARVRLPYTVAFQYLRRGILVRGQWYPVVKMQWLRGQTLAEYVDQHLASVEDLLGLADQWQRMLHDLRAASVAHGDLSHGNILVVDGKLRLVDYDGMYVPALAGREAHEIGHRNYQHPGRERRHFGPHLDHFSAWVIYLSLLALSSDPGLWQQFHGGDECLLLRRSDFEDPAKSQLLVSLSKSFDPRTRRVAEDFRDLLRLPLETLPPLGVAPPRTAASAICAGCGRPLGARVSRCPTCGLELVPGSGGAVPGWLSDHLPRKPTAVAPAEESVTPAAGDLSWIFDRLADNARQESFDTSAAIEHFLFWFTIFLSAVTGGAVALEVISLSVLLQIFAVIYPVLFTFLGVRYRSIPAVRERLEALHMLRPVERTLGSLSRWSRWQFAKNRRLRNRQARFAAKELAQRKVIETKERNRLAELQSEFRRHLAETASARLRLQGDEHSVYRRLDAEFARKIADLSARIDAVAHEEHRRRETALRDLRTHELGIFLRRHRVGETFLPGVNTQVIAALAIAGLVTAADLVPWRLQGIPGLNPFCAETLLRWRRDLEASAVLPQTLPPAALQKVRMEMDTVRHALEEERMRKQQQLINERAIVRNSYARGREDLDRADAAANAKTRAESDRVSARSRRQIEQLRHLIEPKLRKLAEKLDQIQANVALTRQQTCELAWKQSQILHRLGATRELTFAAYLRRVIVGN